ncbi:hypothetical protein KFL_001270060 [Klebsormidium nitens]|uniref:PH domain-containing protein n=1 Tax=Klebsormidium nitens TaxID=105231 RepID=A0A1Y1HXI2_KLENI|nr:hypothetical protein KFL_001270060 [Klebsormidium nitens]|eukprot:GAQ82863.1 hypothetical protein KFL_001270060 [Klebsormidium nitens]
MDSPLPSLLAKPREQVSALVRKAKKHRHRRSNSLPAEDSHSPERIRKRKVYDPRRYYKNNTDSIEETGQPPEGFLLMWVGHWKRWRRRLCVARTPGVLLYHRNDDNRSVGTIDLQDASIIRLEKERHFMVVTKAGMRHFRTISREFRDQWVDHLLESIQQLKEIKERAARGTQKVPKLITERDIQEKTAEWQERERELTSRMLERLQGLEPEKQAFVNQIHSFQQVFLGAASSLSLSSDTAPVVSQFTDPSSFSSLDRSLKALRPENNSQSSLRSLDSQNHEPLSRGGSGSLSTSPSRGGGLGRSARFFGWAGEKASLRRSGDVSADEGDDVGGSFRDLSGSIGASSKASSSRGNGAGLAAKPAVEANGRSKTATKSPLHKDALSDSEAFSRKAPSRLSAEIHEEGAQAGPSETRPPSNAEPELERFRTAKPDALEDATTAVLVESQQAQEGASVPVGMGTGLPVGGQFTPLQRTWQRLQVSYEEILREEVIRVMELEAENVVLLKSVAQLPKMRSEVHKLRAKLGIPHKSSTEFLVHTEGEEGDLSSDEGAFSEDDGNLTAPDGEERYFEALEVLNQRDYLIRNANEDIVDGGPDDIGNEPPDDGSSDAEEEKEGPYSYVPRKRLPAARPLHRGINVWKMLKDAIGKDLTRISMPATINEPLSGLQRTAEELQYRDLLDKGNACESSVDRLLYVTAFAVTAYEGTLNRVSKPFNPLLGETFEWQSADGRTRLIAEQVVHHPPITAVHVSTTDGAYTCEGEIEISSKFWGQFLEVVPLGLVQTKFPKHGDHYVWNKVATGVHNVLIGKMWLDQHGELVVKNLSTGDTSRTKFLKPSGKEDSAISGKVYNARGELQWTLTGSFMRDMYATPEPGKPEGLVRPFQVWKANPPVEDSFSQYGMTQFAITLNEITPQLALELPPTDSRLRPDQRALEDGEHDRSNEEKARLEEKQRATRKELKAEGKEWQGRWFTQAVPGEVNVKTAKDEGQAAWVFNGEYWKARERRDWSACPDIM